VKNKIMQHLNRRPLGATGIKVSEIGLGGLFVNEEMGTSRESAKAVIHRAMELGIDYIDTAPMYGNSQQIVGETLCSYSSDSFLIGTKCGRWNWRDGPYRDLDAFKYQFQQTLKDLNRDSVDILYIHEADWSVFWEDQSIPRKKRDLDSQRNYDFRSAPVTQFLLWARQQKLARFLGFSGNNAALLAHVLRYSEIPVDVVLVAYEYSLIWRRAVTELLPVAMEQGVGVVLGTPFQQGLLVKPNLEWLSQPPEWMTPKLLSRYEKLYEIQKESSMPLTELGLRFLLADPRVSTVIPGAATVEQLEANVRCALRGPLPADLHNHLDKLGIFNYARSD